jgi:Flp pilus assembly protein TadG
MYASSRSPTEAGSRAPQRGQSAVELAVALPVMVLLMMSVFNLTVLISDRLVAGYASRQGARMASELGNGQGGLTTAQVDQQIAYSVLATASNLNFAVISEIDIYRATGADGALQVGTDLLDAYNVVYVGSSPTVGSMTQSSYPVSIRNVTPPSEDSIGVQVKWQYTTTGSPYSFTASLAEYTVMKAAPVLQ